MVDITVTEQGVGTEFAWRLKEHAMLDDYDLPNVLKIQITDRVPVSRKPVMRSKPRVSKIAKMGRIVSIDGWTDDEADVTTLRALKDGATHVFIHPSGDSFSVRVKSFNPDNKANEYGRRAYTLTLWEA